MTASNDITGDKIATKTVSETYRNNYDSIFRKNTTESLDSLTNHDNNQDRNFKNETAQTT